jgi:hypothetical protein
LVISEHYRWAKEKLTVPVPNSCADSSYIGDATLDSIAALATGEHLVIRAERAIAAIALIATGAVASAQAQTQIASIEPTIWDHNGSEMYLVANGQSREFHYQKPRGGMLEAGARPDSLLFRVEIDNGQYSGTAYIFSPHCGQIPFQVKGPLSDNDQRIILTGRAPRLGRNCRANESYTSKLEFRRLKPNHGAQSEEQFYRGDGATRRRIKTWSAIDGRW